jgi:hypothetical protein
MYDEPTSGSYNLGCFYPREPVKHDDIEFDRLPGIKTT